MINWILIAVNIANNLFTMWWFHRIGKADGAHDAGHKWFDMLDSNNKKYIHLFEQCLELEQRIVTLEKDRLPMIGLKQ